MTLIQWCSKNSAELTQKYLPCLQDIQRITKKLEFNLKLQIESCNSDLYEMIPCTAVQTLQRLAKGFSIIALTGLRQSGKTILARQVFADKTYVSLENPDEHEFAEHDPRMFLKRFESGAILDEVQRCPHLLSWLQGQVDV